MRATPATTQEIRVAVRPLSFSVAVDVAVADYLTAPDAAVLESSSTDSNFARYTILADDAVDRILIVGARSPFEQTIDRLGQTVFHARPVNVEGPDLPYLGGWIGYITYDAALSLTGRTRSDPGRAPAADFRLYDTLAVYDHWQHQWYAVAVDWPASRGAGRLPVNRRLDELARRLSRLESSPPPCNDLFGAETLLAKGTDKTGFVKSPDWDESGPGNDWPRDDYLRAVERVRRYIADGDVYQVNLARRFSLHTPHTPEALYRRLRVCNPSSHAAFLRTTGGAILSSSPELFLQHRHGRVITRPIKGTRPRGQSGADDARQCRELECSAKDHAELNMIIDLMRNDLGRVCEFGSVRVTDAGRIETLPTLYHRTATVEGVLRSDGGAGDLLRAAFPGGSVTGAPKIRAMQIIDELEPAPRGVYCGSIGFVGLDGFLSLNIAIRTLIHTGTTVQFHAGSGLVADSDPEQEYAEILAKARALFAAVRHEEIRRVPEPAEGALA